MLYVRIILAPYARIPQWLKDMAAYAGRVEITKTPTYGEGPKFQVIEIDGGDAVFCPDGGVDIQLPGENEWKNVFGPMKVMIISPNPGKVRHNHYFCEKCYALSGEKVGTTKGNRHGKSHFKMKCTRCGRKWKIENV